MVAGRINISSQPHITGVSAACPVNNTNILPARNQSSMSVRTFFLTLVAALAVNGDCDVDRCIELVRYSVAQFSKYSSMLT